MARADRPIGPSAEVFRAANSVPSLGGPPRLATPPGGRRNLAPLTIHDCLFRQIRNFYTHATRVSECE
eukprot:14218173-Alexandrium_andersonii.AAC.1